ncbi:diguanylate cyclase [Metabacillus herbersteinensis]|uniref:Diguanylate cyclase n=1 Tax=Metabacillus herbersteinensis TaxID=283816 RepID=A0ABV6GG19_9BACI
MMMVAGLIIPIIASHFYLNGLSPYGIDLGPVSMSICFLFHGAALLTFQMFNVAPIARDTVFERMTEGIIVLNQNGAIVDYNHSVLNVIPKLSTHVIGKSIEDVLAGKEQLAKIISEQQECDYELSMGGAMIHYHIRFSSLRNKNGSHKGQIITFVDVTERVYMQEKLKQLASIDGLTQVFNRTFFIKKSEDMFNVLMMEGGSVSVIMFDIDYFKKVNDTYGHEAGDSVLTHIASVAKNSLRSTDVIGRYGGEEFIICMPKTPLAQAYELADTIRMKVSESTTFSNNKIICVTASFGISSASFTDGDYTHSIEDLMRQADQALYGAKKNGRNCVQLYEEDLQSIG